MGFWEYQYELVLPETRKQAKDKSKAPALGCLMFTKAFGGVPCGVKTWELPRLGCRSTYRPAPSLLAGIQFQLVVLDHRGHLGVPSIGRHV